MNSDTHCVGKVFKFTVRSPISKTTDSAVRNTCGEMVEVRGQAGRSVTEPLGRLSILQRLDSSFMLRYFTKADSASVWGRLLYSTAPELDQNPVYLRVSARAFGAPRGWQSLLWLPPEMARAAGRLISQIGILPILLLLAPNIFLSHDRPYMTGYTIYASHALRGLADVAYIFGALLLYARAVEGESSALVRNFFRNGASEGWGEALRLTPLGPVDYERGLFVGILQREARSLFLRLTFLTAVIAPVVFLWTMIFRVYNPFFPMQPDDPSMFVALRMIRFTASIGFAAFIQLILVSAINLALMLRAASMRARRERRRRVPQVLFSACVFFTAHLPGTVAYLLWTMNSLHNGRRMESANFGLSDIRGLYIFVLANIPLAWVLIRALLRRYEGEIGKEFAELLSRNDSPNR